MIIIATRMRGGRFKGALATMPLESEIKIEGAFGNLTLHHNAARPAVFLAGGIGITPFRSIVISAAKQKLPHKIMLFYTNRRPEGAPFLDELQALQRQNPNYTLIPTMTKIQNSTHS